MDEKTVDNTPVEYVIVMYDDGSTEQFEKCVVINYDNCIFITEDVEDGTKKTTEIRKSHITKIVFKQQKEFNEE